MSMREKILVGLMIVAVGLGALVLISDRRDQVAPNAASRVPEPLTQLLSRLTAQFDHGTSLETNRYTLAMAGTPWRESLFAPVDRLLSATDRGPGSASALPSADALVYAGYIETPRRRVAIINGIEYVVGDQLDKSSYTVRDIAPDQVVVADPQQRTLALPLAESWEVETP